MTAVYQPSLLEAQVMPPHNGTSTSVAAAAAAIKKVKGQKLAILRELVRRHDWEKPGLTQDEACVFFGKDTGTINPRFNELDDAGCVTTLLYCRKTRATKDARVYVITSKGREVLEASSAGQNNDPAIRLPRANGNPSPDEEAGAVAREVGVVSRD
jgi:DNA-binding PadR family transcriptional regulator